MVLLPQAASTDISVRHLQALVIPGMQIAAAKAAAMGTLSSRRLRFACVKPSISAPGRTPSVYIFLYSLPPLLVLHVRLEDQYHGVHHF